ncbi:MAG: Fic family protein [Proteobacteria bacterium]|nr:Fic family protein [Pseudomonadota bacterium]MBU1389265.1 Fic family protein [Pseudomonadota bacterium]MBU1544085.1 Fic family protein [Pseudomonadota bacterium]MBU2431712.1 Fic family protein [Pseudomonadota bacterium]MBU2480620.1 Fic family protein [Pseudomonadota bacterium]
MEIHVLKHRPAGYTYLIDMMDLADMPLWHTSFVSSSGTHRSEVHAGVIKDIYPARYWPGETVGDHLEFALKYDGVNLGLLAQIFEKVSQDALTRYIKSKPTGKYARRIWFFYEFLIGKQLPVDDLTSGNYVDALETKDYYTVQNGKKSSRHRIVDNLLGSKAFCPVVRRTEKLSELDSSDLRKTCEDIITVYPPELIRRALTYLYNKETKSSFEIEHIKPNASRTQKFIASLELAEKEDFCEKERLIELQNRIVDPRFKDSDYRVSQSYVGQTIVYQKEIIHFICPKPDDLPGLMEGLIASHKRMKAGNVSPVIHAATIAYGFVFLHPFEDGNGRIHRFLIHNILSLQEMIPRGLMFPISAVMLKNPTNYDASLEAFSRPLLQHIDYRLDEMGKMTVENDTASWYQYMDMTPQSEAFYEFITKTIQEELVEELRFLANHEHTKKAIQDIIDIPDRLINLFIQLCLQNNGSLSAKKRSAHFDFLTDEELSAMEQTVRDGYNRPD